MLSRVTSITKEFTIKIKSDCDNYKLRVINYTNVCYKIMYLNYRYLSVAMFNILLYKINKKTSLTLISDWNKCHM